MSEVSENTEQYSTKIQTDADDQEGCPGVATNNHASFFVENYPLGLLSVLRDFA